MRSEIESLRAKTREQAQLLARMQSLAARPSNIVALNGHGETDVEAQANGHDAAAMPGQDQSDFERQIRTLKARTEDQSAEISRLKAAIAVFEGGDDGKSLMRDSRIALKARMQSLETQSTQQAETIHKLRSELASANERLARQAAHFTSELKRLGAGTLPASGQARRAAEPARLTLSERVAQARIATPLTEASAAGNGAKANDVVDTVASGGDHHASVAVDREEPDTAGAGSRAGGGDVRPKLLDRIASLSRNP